MNWCLWRDFENLVVDDSSRVIVWFLVKFSQLVFAVWMVIMSDFIFIIPWFLLGFFFRESWNSSAGCFGPFIFRGASYRWVIPLSEQQVDDML